MTIKNLFKMSYLVPISAFIVSLCAIIISIIEVRVMDEQKKASVWPITYSSRTTHSVTDIDKSSFFINVTNSGVGPAIIKYVEVKFDGKIIKTWDEMLQNIEKDTELNVSQSVLTNNVILPGEEHHPLEVYGKLADKLNRDTKRIRLKICYCSIYEECWILDESEPRMAGLAIPHKTEQCEIDRKNQFLR